MVLVATILTGQSASPFDPGVIAKLSSLLEATNLQCLTLTLFPAGVVYVSDDPAAMLPLFPTPLYPPPTEVIENV